MTAPQRTASTNAASVFGSSKPSGLIVSGRPWSGATVCPTSSSQTTASSAEPVLLEGLQLDDVGEAGLAFVGRAARQALRAHVGDGPGGAADVDDLAPLRQRRHERRGARRAASVPRNDLPRWSSTEPSPSPSMHSVQQLPIMDQFCDFRKSCC